MLEVETNATVLLELSLADGDATKFPRARIYNSAGTEQTGAPFNSPVDLSHVANGLYQATTTAAAAAGKFSVHYVTYQDAGHTTVSNKFARVGEDLRVVTPIANQVFDAPSASHVVVGSIGEALIFMAGNAGKHSLLDGGSGFANVQQSSNNQLTSARLRIFASAAARAAATPGAADGADGELKRIDMTGSYVAGNQSPPSIDVLQRFARDGA